MAHTRLERSERVAVDETMQPTNRGGDCLPHSKLALGSESFEELEQARSSEASGYKRCAGVVDKVVALDRVERCQRVAAETRAKVVGIRDTEESVSTGIHHDGRRGVMQSESGLGGIEQHHVRGLADAHCDWGNEQGWVGRFGTEAKPLLAQHKVVAVERHADEWKARLPDPAVHQLAHWFVTSIGSGDLLDAVPKVACLSAAVRVRAQVLVYSLTEALFAEVLLQHSQQRSTLLVGEHVEHAVAVGGCPHLELDRAGAGERIDFERIGTLEAEVGPAFPIGSEHLDRHHFHERREGFVEPDAIPPTHRHQIAEPHMGKLVAHHVGHQLLLVLGARLRVEQQQRLAVGDAPEILHRSSRKIGQRDHVDLLAWIGDAVIVLEPLEGNSADVEC